MGDEFEVVSSGINESILVWLIIVILIVAMAVVLFLVLRKKTRRVAQVDLSVQMQTLLITVPKDTQREASEKTSGNSFIVEQIGLAEVLWSALGGLKPEGGIKNLFGVRADQISLEIVAQNDIISFYVVVPPALRSFMEQQIQSHYPHANIEAVNDYNIFLARGAVAGSFIAFSKMSSLPTRTYVELEADSLNSITNSLSKIPVGSGAAIQLVVRSAKSVWRRDGVRIASAMQQGKSLNEVSTGHGVTKVLKGAWKLGGEMFASSAKKGDKGSEHEKYQLSPLEQEMIKGIEKKASKAGLDVTIRVVTSAPTQSEADRYLYDITNSFNQFNIYEYGNSYLAIKPKSLDSLMRGFIHREMDEYKKIILNTEELATLYHFPLASTETPNIKWLGARAAAAPVNIPKEGIQLGLNYYRGEEVPIRMKDDDRRRHVYIIGKSGTGKSILLQNMIVQDIKAGKGVAVIDPHGDLVEGVLGQIPPERVDDVIVFNPSDTEQPVGLNMLEFSNPEQMDFAAQEMISIFYKLFPPEMIGPMFEHNMRNVMLTLMADTDSPGTIADIPRMFTDKEFQKYKVGKLTDPVVRAFWEKEMAQTTDFHKSEMLGYLISKVGRFVENEMMRNIIGQPKSGFNFRQVMDQQKIVLVNLSKGTTGEVNSSLLGLIIVSKMQMAAMSRANLPEAERKDFYLYIDEFQNFITDSIATILSEARKYRLDLIIANQYLKQLVNNNDTKIRDAVLGTVGTLISFKIGIEDAEILAKEFEPVFSAHDIINIEQYNAYVKLLIDNAPARPFNMKTLPPAPSSPELASKIKELSRLKYGKPRAVVRDEILERTKLGSASTKPAVPPERTL